MKQAESEFNSNNEWNKFRIYYLTDNSILKERDNTIAVRVYDGFQDGGIYEGPIGIITQKRFRKIKLEKENEFNLNKILKMIFGD